MNKRYKVFPAKPSTLLPVVCQPLPEEFLKQRCFPRTLGSFQGIQGQVQRQVRISKRPEGQIVAIPFQLAAELAGQKSHPIVVFHHGQHQIMLHGFQQNVGLDVMLRKPPENLVVQYIFFRVNNEDGSWAAPHCGYPAPSIPSESPDSPED